MTKDLLFKKKFLLNKKQGHLIHFLLNTVASLLFMLMIFPFFPASQLKKLPSIDKWQFFYSIKDLQRQ